MPALLLPAVVFVGTFLLAFALLVRPHERLSDRLAPYVAGAEATPPRDVVLERPLLYRLLAPLSDRLVALALHYTPARQREQAALRLRQAGSPMSVGAFFALRALCLVGLPVGLLLAMLAQRQPIGPREYAVLVVGFFVGRMLPNLYLRRRIRRRSRLVERALPDSLDLLVVCVEGGLSLEGALAKVAERTRGPLADELRQALQEISLGAPRRDALRNLIERTAAPSLRILVNAILQAERMGTSVAVILRTQAEQLRVKRRQEAEEKARKAPIKMVPIIVTFILPALFIMVLGPMALAFLQFIERTSPR